VEGPGASLLEGPNPSAAHHCGARHLNYAIIRLIWPLCGLLLAFYPANIHDRDGGGAGARSHMTSLGQTSIVLNRSESGRPLR
jgi:hypothetical protein